MLLHSLRDAKFLAKVVVLLGLAVPPALAATWKSWDTTIDTPKRFKVLKNFNYEAVLDKETGLVWELNPSGTASLDTAFQRCSRKSYGGHGGFRLPTVGELNSLFNNAASNPHLPPGHPFTGITTLGDPEMFWTSTPVRMFAGQILMMSCGHRTDFGGNGYHCVNTDPDDVIRYWCVRGPD